MCRTSSRPHPKMGPTPKSLQPNHNSYANRLNELKKALKPYRDNNANCLRLITRSARVNLNKHWKSLENLFTASHDRKERAQNEANEMLENGDENARPAAEPTADDAVDKFRRMHVDR